MDLDPELQEQLGTALESFLSEDESTRLEVYQFLHEFKSTDQQQFIYYLILHLSNIQTTAQSRSIAAIFLYNALHKRSPEQQRHFVLNWNSIFPIEVRDQLRAAAFEGLMSGEQDLQVQCSALLGLFYAIENYNGNLKNPADFQVPPPTFYISFEELIGAAIESEEPDLRILLYNLFTFFGLNSIELDLNCSKSFLSNLSPLIYNAFLSGLASDFIPLQKKALDSLSDTFLIFKRHFSFSPNRDDLLDMVFQFIDSGEPELLSPSYQLLMTCIDCSYPEMVSLPISPIEERESEPRSPMEDIEMLTANDIQSDDPDRQIEACYLWSVIAEVEIDLQTPDKQLVKKIHQEWGFDKDSPLYSKWAFDELFDVLVELICSTDPEDTNASISLDRTPSHAAFSCLNLLTRAVDADALPRIYQYVEENASAEDWRLRYTAALLLNGATQVRSIDTQYDPQSILVPFDFFVNAIVDPVPRVSEAAMYSLGRLIKKFPDLIVDQDLFSQLCQNVAERLDVSDELTSRACWLLNICFSVFSRDDEESPLVTNFDMFAELLLNCADEFDVNAQLSALGALDRLVEHTPSTIAEQYNRLFEAITAKLQFLIEQYQDGNILNSAKSTQQMIGLLSLVHHIVINVGPMISNVADQLMEMLLATLDFQNGSFVCEVLPSMGAVARAIQEDFTKFLPPLIEKVFSYLEEGDSSSIYPAAVFIADIFNSNPDPPFEDELVDKFVAVLSDILNDDTQSVQTRIAVYSAMANIAFYIEEKCEPWIGDFINMLGTEARSMLSNKDEIDNENALSFTVECLTIYSGLLPIMKASPKGERRVKSFFLILEKIDKINYIKYNSLTECVILIRQIADMFQKSMNVYLNKPAVLNILRAAMSNKVDNQNLSELAEETYDFVKRL